MRSLLRPLTFTLLAASCFAGCGADAIVDEQGRWQAIGNPDAETVIVYAQGGPSTELDVGEAEDIVDSLNLDEVYVVAVEQVQTRDPERFTGSDVSFEDAIAANLESVEALAEAVDAFASNGKTVHVVGVSFGAFLVQELLVQQGNVADGYLIEVGRLAMPNAVWGEFAEGRFVGFENGTDIISVPIEDAGMGAGSPAGDRNMARLAAGVGHRRYLDLLAGMDLSNVVYVFGNNDEQVGRLTEAEVVFLTDNNATVIASNGDHGGAIGERTEEAFQALLGYRN